MLKEIYKAFSHIKDYSFRDQIQRAALSVMSNIAEGFDRGSNKEFIQFLVIARGSLERVHTLSKVFISKELTLNIERRTLNRL